MQIVGVTADAASLPFTWRHTLLWTLRAAPL
jgi:hypothetical protein